MAAAALFGSGRPRGGGFGGGKGSGGPGGGDLLLALYDEFGELSLHLAQGRLDVQRRRLGRVSRFVLGELGPGGRRGGPHLGRPLDGQPARDDVQLVHGRFQRMHHDVGVDRRALGVVDARVEDPSDLGVEPIAGHIRLDRRLLGLGVHRTELLAGRGQLALGLGEDHLVLLEENGVLVILLGVHRDLVLVVGDLLGKRLGTGLERADLRIGTVDGARRRLGGRRDHKE